MSIIDSVRRLFEQKKIDEKKKRTDALQQRTEAVTHARLQHYTTEEAYRTPNPPYIIMPGDIIDTSEPPYPHFDPYQVSVPAEYFCRDEPPQSPSSSSYDSSSSSSSYDSGSSSSCDSGSSGGGC